MSRLLTSWRLLKCSLRVVRENRKLLWFQVVIFMLTVLIATFFMAPLAFWNTGFDLRHAAHWKALAALLTTWRDQPENVNVTLNSLGYILAGVLYAVSVFMATFFNVAFLHEILHALNGQPVSILGGLRFALTRLKAIAAWSLFTGTIGFVIKTFEQRVGWLGRRIVRLTGIAWSVAAVFAIPVIVREDKHSSPLRFLKTSAGILKKTWGESLTGFAGIRLIGVFIFLMSAALLTAAFVVCGSLEALWAIVVFSVLWLAGFLLCVILFSVINHVYRAALYIYATEGVVPGPFDQEQMNAAWKLAGARKAQ